MAADLRIPPFPRWTGMRAHLTGPHTDQHGRTVAHVRFRITRRALMWARWRMLLNRVGR